MTKLLSALVLATAMFTGGAPSSAAEESTLALAMMRPDGILTPFAVFDGKSWIAAWPEPQDKLVLDRMIENLPSWWRTQQRPVPSAWHVVRPSQPTLKVAVLERVVFNEHCGIQSGLLTDIRPRRTVHSLPDARMLATDRPIAVEAPGPVTTNGRSGEGRATHRPMGTLKTGGSTFRVVLLIGYEGESVSVRQVTAGADREVLRRYIGGC